MTNSQLFWTTGCGWDEKLMPEELRDNLDLDLDMDTEIAIAKAVVMWVRPMRENPFAITVTAPVVSAVEEFSLSDCESNDQDA